jgi:hypothetical protein
MHKINNGERAPRPEAAQLPVLAPSDEEWRIIEDSWDHRVSSRPTMKAVLRRLKEIDPRISLLQLPGLLRPQPDPDLAHGSLLHSAVFGPFLTL